MHRLALLAIGFSTAFALAADPGSGNAAPGTTSSGKVVCQLRQHNGRPTLFVNGQPRFPMAFASYFPQPFRYKQFGDHGVHVHFLCLPLGDKWISWSVRRVSNHMPGIWTGPDDLDFAAVDRKIGEILAADPQAYIILRVYCESPSWWDARHSEDVRTVAYGVPLRQSFSSARWRKDTAEVLARLVRYVSSAPYGDRVIGYMPTAGDTEEVADTVSDLSPCAQQAFRHWIEARYANDADAVRRLFHCEPDAICVPPIARRLQPSVPIVGLTAGDCGNFLDPQKSRLVIDYRQFESEKMADTVIGLCRAVKEASGGRLLCGAFYGYTRIFPDTGHLALRRMLDSDVVDFISTPYSSGGRKYRLSLGYSDFQNPTQVATLQKAGKLFYAETDTRTSVSRWISETRPEIDPDGEYKQEGWLGPPTIQDSLEVLKMVFAKILVTGVANWWFDLWGGWYDDPQILQLFGRMQTVREQSLRVSRKSVAQIAVLVDEKSYCYMPFSVAEHGGRFRWVAAQLGQFGRIGAPYDVYLLDDVKDLDLTPYRMVVLLNAFVLSDDQRRVIRTRCMADNRLLMWLYAPGLIQGDRLALGNVSSLLGMKLAMQAAQPETAVRLDLPDAAVSYKASAMSPMVWVQGGADAAHGRMPDGRVVVAEKAGPNYRNLLVTMPPLPWNALQHYARSAGVHLYTDRGDVILANEHYLVLAAGTAGKRTLRLPHAAAMKELLSFGKDEQWAKNTQFEIDMPAHACRIFQW
jgi:beta-galactosidase